MRKKWTKLITFSLTFIFFLIVPWLASLFLGSNYVIELLVQAMVYGILALSLNLLLGYLGLPSLGHAAYLGISAYTVAICITKLHMAALSASIIAIFLTSFTAALFGLFALRARGVYFLMITLALSMVVWGLAYRWVSLTSGDMGIAGVARPQLGPWSLKTIENYYYFVFFIFLLSFFIIYRIVHSPFGHTLVGIKESESRMRTLGYNCWLHQYICFVISGFFGGVAGVLFIFYNRFIGPASLEILSNMEVILMVALGGPGTITGPLIGSALIVFLKNFVSIYTKRWLIILGSIYIITILYAPKGLMELMDVFKMGKKFLTVKPYNLKNVRKSAIGNHENNKVKERKSQGKPDRIWTTCTVNSREPCLKLEKITKTFGGLRALNEVSLAIAPGERRAIIGPNGAGKTTLFNIITGGFRPTNGKIFFRGEDVTRLPCHRRTNRGIARTFQITNLFFNLSVIENMVLAAQALENTKFSMFRSITSYRHLYEKGMELLGRIGIEELKDELVRNLSYGVQRQVEVMLALTKEPQLLLLDEPTAGLSPAEAVIMVEMLKNLPLSITILIIEHAMDVAFELADSITVLHFGRVIAEGNKDAIKENRTVQEIYLGVK